MGVAGRDGRGGGLGVLSCEFWGFVGAGCGNWLWWDLGGGGGVKM